MSISCTQWEEMEIGTPSLVWSVTYSVHEWPQSKSAVHAASCDDDVSSQIQAAADGRGPDKERGFCLQEHVSEEE